MRVLRARPGIAGGLIQEADGVSLERGQAMGGTKVEASSLVNQAAGGMPGVDHHPANGIPKAVSLRGRGRGIRSVIHPHEFP